MPALVRPPMPGEEAQAPPALPAAPRPHGPEVQDALELFGDSYLASHRVTPQQERYVRDLRACRTSALGVHRYECESCGDVTYSYDSCRNRHCPKCQGLAREEWALRRSAELLDVPHYHVVFTVPEELNPLFLRNQKAMSDLLFSCSWGTVREFAADRRHMGARAGAISVPRTWTQTLLYHPHVHMVVPAGGLTERGGWRHCGRSFFAPVKAMSQVFRARLVAGVRALARKGSLDLGGCAAHLAGDGLEATLRQLFSKPWVVHCERPLGSAAHVVRYLARYTHRAAIANSRVVSVGPEGVSFTWRDSREGRRTEKVMALPGEEFVRRLLLHVLPPRYTRVRYFGILACRGKSGRLEECRRLTRTPRRPLPEGEAMRDLLVERLIGRPRGTCARCGGDVSEDPSFLFHNLR